MACARSSTICSPASRSSRTACRWSPSLWPTPLSPALPPATTGNWSWETVVVAPALWDAHLSAHGLKSSSAIRTSCRQGPNKEPLLIMTRTVLLPGLIGSSPW